MYIKNVGDCSLEFDSQIWEHFLSLTLYWGLGFCIFNLSLRIWLAFCCCKIIIDITLWTEKNREEGSFVPLFLMLGLWKNIWDAKAFIICVMTVISEMTRYLVKFDYVFLFFSPAIDFWISSTTESIGNFPFPQSCMWMHLFS